MASALSGRALALGERQLSPRARPPIPVSGAGRKSIRHENPGVSRARLSTALDRPCPRHPTKSPPADTPPSVTRARSRRQGGAREGFARQPRGVGAGGAPQRSRSRCSRTRPRAASPSWSRSATGGCSPRRSPSTAAPRRSWRWTSRTPPSPGLRVQACGDAHLSNFGVFAAPDRRLVMDVNDFDETLPGPWEWDVKRLAASFAIAGRDRDFTPKRDPRRRPQHRPLLPRGDAGVRGDAKPRRLVRAPRRRDPARRGGQGRRRSSR